MASKTNIDKCQATPYDSCKDIEKGITVIRNFRHRGLRRFYERGDASRVHPEYVTRLRAILTLLDAAVQAEDMNYPGSGFHRLRGDLQEFYAVRVSGNWRVIFRFEDGEVLDVDYLDYH